MVAVVGLGLQHAPPTSRRVSAGPGLSRNRVDYDRRRRLNADDGDTTRYKAILRFDPCIVCGERPEPGGVQDVDHIVGLNVGGCDGWENMAAACGRHNRGRKDTPLLTYLLRVNR